MTSMPDLAGQTRSARLRRAHMVITQTSGEGTLELRNAAGTYRSQAALLGFVEDSCQKCEEM